MVFYQVDDNMEPQENSPCCWVGAQPGQLETSDSFCRKVKLVPTLHVIPNPTLNEGMKIHAHMQT